jgi:hypothetical protein
MAYALPPDVAFAMGMGALGSMFFGRKKKKRTAKGRNKCRNRKEWSAMRDNWTDKQFVRRFKLDKDNFAGLLDKARGERHVHAPAMPCTPRRLIVFVFDSLHSLSQHRSCLQMVGHTPSFVSNEKYACNSSGSPIAPECKLAISLRWLAGGSYLDICDIYDISESSFYPILWETLEIIDKVLKIRFPTNDPISLSRMSEAFGKRTGGVLHGCVGALDGWAPRLQRPQLSAVPNPAQYFSRKGFCTYSLTRAHSKQPHTALITLNLHITGCFVTPVELAIGPKRVRSHTPLSLSLDLSHPSLTSSRSSALHRHTDTLNVQAMCDANRRITFLSILADGATHDSTAFAISNLSTFLASGKLPEPYWIAGDSAYPLSDCLLTPYGRARDGTIDPARDTFNFFQSSARMKYVECRIEGFMTGDVMG